MSKISRRISLLLLPLAVPALCACAFANVWKASLIPASLNPDNTIRLVGGEVQDMILALQADQAITARAQTHNITLVWNLPPGVSIVGNGGSLILSNPKVQSQPDGRTNASFQAQVKNNAILGVPGTRLNSEWNNQSIFINVPQSIPAGQNYLQLKLTGGDYNQVFKWSIKIETFAPPAKRPKRTALGFWDYNYSAATNAAAARGVAKLFRDSGVTFTESAQNETYRKALQAEKITTGGYVWEGAFFDSKYTDANASGNISTHGFPNPQRIITLPADAPIAGVAQMAAAAKTGDGIATFDFESHGLTGFTPAAITAFKKQYNVTATDFEIFRQYVAANGFKVAQSTDPIISRTWRQWAQFRSEQVAGYLRRVREAFKTQLPDGRIAVTSAHSYGKDSILTQAWGCDNAAIVPYVDMVLPQIYLGYDGAAAKLAMQMTAGWREEIQQQKAKTLLWPLLLVRYAGAHTGNSPQRLRQQIIGCLANGANGIMFYYPGMMDAPYWEMLARTSEDIAKYEDFYQDGKRVDDVFPLSGMPQGDVQIDVYPNYQETMRNPDWSFTAHRLDNKVLLTMLNLREKEALVFDVNTGNAKVLSTQNAAKAGDHKWRIQPQQVAFIVLGHL